jgi:putative addiction module killer protein
MMADSPRKFRIYSAADARQPFREWIDSLKDRETQARILVRMERIRLGNLGDCKSPGGGVSELRIATGPGYRVYFGQLGKTVVVLLCGGIKATQRKDIAEAKAYWQDYRSRTNANQRILR